MLFFRKSRLFFSAVTLGISILLTLESPALGYWTWSSEQGKFINEEGTAEGPAEEQFKYALRFLEEGKPEKAIDELENLGKKYPNAKITADALFQLGVLYEKKSDNYKAFKTYRKIMETYPQSPRMDEVVARTYAIGNLFLSGQKPRVMGMAIMPALPKAVEVFKAISENAPFSTYGDRATFNLAIAYKKSRRYEDAIKTFQKLIDDYPTSELLSDARFQMADTSFQMSIRRVDRDLRSLDVAEEEAEEFLRQYPESHITPRAKELIKVINEKNAEKNFKIGLYYEQENYVDSAVIYYEDVIKKYPGTTWYGRAEERLGRLKDPGRFMKLREEEIKNRLNIVASKEMSIQAQVDAFKTERDLESEEIARRERERLMKEREGLEKELDALSRSKAESVKTRSRVLRIKQRELNEKRKTLKEKKKHYKKRMTPDLVSAFQRWEESLKAEEYSLERERADLETLKESWGIRPSLFERPFFGLGAKPVLSYREKDFRHLAEVQNKLMIEEEVLREKRDLLLEDLERLNQTLSDFYLKGTYAGETAQGAGGELEQKHKLLVSQKAVVEELAGQLKKKGTASPPKKGALPFAGVLTPLARTAALPLAAAGKSISWAGSALPAVTAGKGETRETLEEKENELKVKIDRLKNEIELTQKALEEERKEKGGSGSPAPSAARKPSPTAEPNNPREVRREIRILQRELRAKYQEVEDRKKNKDRMIKRLEAEVSEVKRSTSVFERSKAALKPVTGAAWLMRSFVFGLPDKEKAAMGDARRLEKGLSPEQVSRVSSLKEEIEYEILMIDTRRSEILELETKLSEKTAFAKANKIPVEDVSIFRPDYILKSNFEKMGRLIAPHTREEILVNRLDRSSQELTDALREMEMIDRAMEKGEAEPAGKKSESPKEAPPATPEVKTPPSAMPKPEESEGTRQRYREACDKYDAYKREYEDLLRKHLGGTGKEKILAQWEKERENIEHDRARLIAERNELEKMISGTYRKEAETIEKMRTLTHEKMKKIDDKLGSLRFRSGGEAGRLAEEKGRMEKLLEKFNRRMRDLRNEEIKVLEPLEAGYV